VLQFWISPEVTTDFRLRSLTLLGTSAHIGCDRLSASMARTDDPATSGDGVGAVEEWTVSIDRDTVTAPPLTGEGDEPLPRERIWGGGAASVALTIDPDGVVLTIMLRLDRSLQRPYTAAWAASWWIRPTGSRANEVVSSSGRRGPCS